MMVDYSAWLESVEFPVDAVFLWLLLGATACLIGGAMVVYAVSTVKTTMINRDAPVWLGIAGALLTLIGVLLMLFGAIPATQAMGDGSSITFVEQTEKAFDVRSLSCDGGCPAYRLPDDGMKARWIKDNRVEHGEFVIDGSKVGLAGPDGTLLKETE